MSLNKNILYVLSDNHINRSKFESEKWEFTRKNLKEAFEKIDEDLDKTKNNFLIFGWDLFDKFESTNDFRKWEFWFVNLLKESFQWEKIKIIFITWNHDCNNVSEYTALSWFNEYWTLWFEDLNVIENDLISISNDDLDIICAPFPFLHENRRKWKWRTQISKLKEKLNENWKFKIMLSHFIVDWVQSWKHWGLSYRNVHSNEKELVEMWFDLILLWDNHIHYDENKIISIWSSEQVSFSEEWDEKHILKISFKEDKEKEYKVEKIILEEASKKKITITIDVSELNDENFDEELEKIFNDREKDHFSTNFKRDTRVKVNLNNEQQDKITKIRSYLHKIKNNSISYQEDFSIWEKKDVRTVDELDLKDLLNEDNLITEYYKKFWWTKDESFQNWLLDRKNRLNWDKKEFILEKIFSEMNKK